MKASDRLKTADFAFLKKLAPCNGPTGKPVHQTVMELFQGDAERAFAQALPVGSPTPEGVNPGRIYQAFREIENPANRKKEADLLYGQAEKITGDLGKWSTDLLRDLQARIPRMGDTETRFRRQRESAIQMAMDYPRALLSMKATLGTLHHQYSIDGLRAARFFLMRSEKDWTAFVRRMRDTRPDPVDAWCSRMKEMQTMAETVRRGLSA